jgi:hypothetical protein
MAHVEAVEAARAGAAADLQRLRADFQAAVGTADELKARLASPAGPKATVGARSGVDAAQAAQARAKEALAHSRADLAAAQEREAALAKRVNELTAQLTALQSHADMLREELDGAEEQMAKLVRARSEEVRAARAAAQEAALNDDDDDDDDDAKEAARVADAVAEARAEAARLSAALADAHRLNDSATIMLRENAFRAAGGGTLAATTAPEQHAGLAPLPAPSLSPPEGSPVRLEAGRERAEVRRLVREGFDALGVLVKAVLQTRKGVDVGRVVPRGGRGGLGGRRVGVGRGGEGARGWGEPALLINADGEASRRVARCSSGGIISGGSG